MTNSLRSVVGLWADTAKKKTGRPSGADVEELKSLWDKRKERGVLADTHLQSNYDLKWVHPGPDWTSWASIAACFGEYHAALAEKDSRGAPGMAAIRMQGV